MFEWPHDHTCIYMVQSLRRCQHSQSEKKHEKIKLSSIDAPMSSESVTKWNGKRMRSSLVKGGKTGQQVSTSLSYHFLNQLNV